MEQGRPAEASQQVRLWIRGDVAEVTGALHDMLAEEGLQLDSIVRRPPPIGLMEASDIVVTIVISAGTAVAANYLQDKRITARIDAALDKVKAKAVGLQKWLNEQA